MKFSDSAEAVVEEAEAAVEEVEPEGLAELVEALRVARKKVASTPGIA
jgi:hypothetical protein